MVSGEANRAETPCSSLATAQLTAADHSRCFSVLSVEPLAQVLAGLEERHELLATDTAAPVRGLRPTRGRAVLHREGAEAPQLHPVAARQRLDDLVEDDVDDALDVAVIEMLDWPRQSSE